MIEFLIIGEPTPKPAPRVGKTKTGKTIVFKPGRKVRSWERCVREWAVASMSNHTPFLAKDEVECMLLFALRRPSSHYTKTGSLKRSAPITPNRKPDLDNLVKSTLDAMEGIVFDNDSRITKRITGKVYAELGQPTGCYVIFKPLQNDTYTELYHQTLLRYGAEGMGVLNA